LKNKTIDVFGLQFPLVPGVPFSQTLAADMIENVYTSAQPGIGSFQESVTTGRWLLFLFSSGMAV
jgi:hypothetical protein